MSLENMAMAANEAREQRIIRLRQMFKKMEVVTVASAVKKTGYSRKTVVSWCKAGNIPLFDEIKQNTVVPMTPANTPAWFDDFH